MSAVKLYNTLQKTLRNDNFQEKSIICKKDVRKNLPEKLAWYGEFASETLSSF